MKAYQVNGKGIEELKLVDLPDPQIKGERDVLIGVKACSLNYRDLMVAKGTYQYTSGLKPFIPVSDMAGEVLQIGEKVTSFKVGDKVLNAPFRHWPAGRLQASWAQTFIAGGGIDGVLAEKIIYPEDALVKVPEHLNFQEASTFTIAGLTAWASIVTHGRTRPGEWVLLQGTGGVSMFAAQIAHALGARTIMTTSNDEKAEFVKRHFNVTETINYQNSEWSKKVKEITGGVDVVVDVVGGETLANSLKACTFGARVAVIGILGGQDTHIQIRDLLKHQVQIKGIFMESTEELRALMRMVEATQLRPHIDKVFPFNHAREAYKYLESQKHIGKVVIEVTK